jgi:serine/threonine-protein kinase
MAPERWEQVKRIYDSALKRTASQRAAYLDQVCAGDVALRSEVESLLAYETRADNFIEAPALEVAAGLLTAEPPCADVGRQIGPYQVRALLGAGGMGEVYLAEDNRLSRKVALKLLPARFTQDADRVRRFEQEARAASALNHPNIITIHEIGQSEGLHYIVTEYIEGQTLRQRLLSGRLNLPVALDLAIQIAGALVTAHEAGIIHRDIKPENVMLRRDGYVKVLDFGLAKLTEKDEGGRSSGKDEGGRMKDEMKRAADSSSILPPSSFQNPSSFRPHPSTEPGTVMGTAQYMSPEQARGLRVDARTDIFSLGVVLYEMLTGRAPFAGATPGDVIAALLAQEPPPLAQSLPDVPPELERIVAKALRKDREERYQVAKELLLDLKSLKQELDFAEKRASTRNDELAVARQSGRSLLSEVARPKRGAVFALAVIALICLAYFYFGRASQAIDSLAVLPFVNESADPNMEYLSDGITDSIIYSLSQLPNLKVKPRSAVFRYKGRGIDPAALARELGVRAILTGRVSQRGDDLSINAELVDARDNTLLWGQPYHRKLSDLLSVQEEIAKEISEKLRLRLSGEEQKRLTKRYTDNTEAYQLYLQGRYHWNRRTAEGYKRAIEHFEQAIEKDSSYALAYTGLADCYNVLSSYGIASPKESFPKARVAVTRALEIDDQLAEAHTSLAQLKYYYDWGWAVAEQEFKRAVSLNPNYVTAHQWYALELAGLGRTAEALREIKRAQELDPTSLIVNVNAGWILYHARQYEEAIAQHQKSLDLDPNFARAHWAISEPYAQQKKYEEAIAELHKARQLDDTPILLALLGQVYASVGRRSEAQQVIDELQQLAKHTYVDPYFLAEIYTALGERAQALQELERAYQERSSWLVWLKVEPKFDGLRADARFTELLRRVGLAP